MNSIYYGYFDVYGLTQLSKIFVARTRKGVCFIELLSTKVQEQLPPLIPLLAKEGTKGRFLQNKDAIKDIQDALTGYFAGKTASFNIPVDLSASTPFQQQVWRKLMEIPYGEVRTYKWVAEEIGSPAARAIGQACASNPIPIIIPCHRVIRADGSLGGYSSGVSLKRQLLRLEGLLL